jgi:undecaprenyl-diphosphatase
MQHMFATIQAWDTALLTWVRGFESYAGSLAGIGVSELANLPALVGVSAVTFLILVRTRRFHDAFGLIIAGGGAQLGAYALKLLTDRPRPPFELASYLEPGSSFPSAHAAVVVGLYGFLAWLVWRDCTLRRWWHYATVTAAGILVIAVGGSRIYLGVHYPSDVLAGYAVGAIFLCCGILLTRRGKDKNLC